MEENKNGDLEEIQHRYSFKLVVALIVAIYTLLDLVFVGYPHQQPNWADLLFRVGVVAALGILLEFAYEILKMVGGLGTNIKRVLQIVGNLEKDAKKSKGTLVENMENELPNGITRMLLRDWHEKLDSTISLSEKKDGFVVSHEILSMYSYADFWKLLAEEQEHRNKNNESPLHVEVTHSCSLDIWTDHILTNRLLDHHRQFCEAKGEVTRILCARGIEPDEKVLKAAQAMKKMGVKVLYYDFTEGVVDHSFSWDFLHVKETNVSVIWEAYANVPGNIMRSSVYQSVGHYKKKDLGRLWQEIKAHSKEIKL